MVWKAISLFALGALVFANEGLSEAPILTGLSRQQGRARAYFLTSDRQNAFSLALTGEWCGYRLVEVDFVQRTAVLEENGHRFLTRFGSGVAELPSNPIERPSRRAPVRSPFTSDDELFRAQNGDKALMELQNQRLAEALKAGTTTSDAGVTGAISEATPGGQ